MPESKLWRQFVPESATEAEPPWQAWPPQRPSEATNLRQPQSPNPFAQGIFSERVFCSWVFSSMNPNCIGSRIPMNLAQAGSRQALPLLQVPVESGIGGWLDAFQCARCQLRASRS